MTKLIKVLKFIVDKYIYIRSKIAEKHYRRKLNKFLCKNQECSLYIGMPGSGKTTYIAYLVNMVNKCNYGEEFRVFCNVPVDGAYPFKKDDIGVYDMKNSLILLDEAGIIYDNRKYSDNTQFNEQSLEFLKLLRHHRCNIALFSQSLDIDVKWVRMAKSVFFVRRSLLRGFTSIIRVVRTLDVNPDTHKIEDFYDKPTGLLARIFHFRFLRFPYYKMFDSYLAPKLRSWPPNRYKKYDFKKE